MLSNPSFFGVYRSVRSVFASTFCTKSSSGMIGRTFEALYLSGEVLQMWSGRAERSQHDINYLSGGRGCVNEHCDTFGVVLHRFGTFKGAKTAFLSCFNLFSRARTLTNEKFCLSLSSVREKKGFSSLIYAPIVCEYLPKMTMIEALVNEWKSLQPLKEDASRLRRHHTVASAS